MLNNIPRILSPELVAAMMEMGHGDEILIADGNFPGRTCSHRLVRADGLGGTQLLQAILELFPLDMGADYQVVLMEAPERPPIWDEFDAILPVGRRILMLDRFAFYEHARTCFVTVQSGEDALFANIILKKGTIS